MANVSFRIVLYIMGNSRQKVLSMDKNCVSMGISMVAMFDHETDETGWILE
jgi:hypothetical protein